MKYRFEGYDRSAKLVQGEMEASSEMEVKNRLREQSLSPRSIMQVQANFGFMDKLMVPQKPALKEFTIFIRQWATMQGAGMSLIQTLGVLSEQALNQNFGKVLTGISKSIQEGSTLTQALQRYPTAFDKVFINLVSAGEGSGTLDRILDRLAVYYEKIAAIKRKMISASLYPTMILVVVFAIIVGLLVFVVPMFERMFAEQGKALPGPTQMLIDVSLFVRNHIVIMIAGVSAVIGSVVYVFKNDEAKEKLDPYLLMIPVFGPILQKSCIARFARTLGTLMQAGVPIIDAMVLSAKTSGNFEIESAIMRTQDLIKEGSSIAQPLLKEKAFPKMVVSMIAVGEQTGELEKMLIKVAEFYEEEVDASVDAMTSILEPLMIVIMGGVVVAVLIPLYLPIFKLGDLMGGG